MRTRTVLGSTPVTDFRAAGRGISAGVAERRSIMTDRDHDVPTGTEVERDEPNEYGFAGDPSTPEPRREPADPHAYAEDVAIPSGDLTGALSESLEGAVDRDED